MRIRRFNPLDVLNVHKELTNKFDLPEVGNEFRSLNDEQFQYFGKFVESDLTKSSWLLCFIYSRHHNHRFDVITDIVSIYQVLSLVYQVLRNMVVCFTLNR